MTTSCAKVKYPSYYTLALAPTLAVNGGHTLGVLAVRDFNTAAYLRQGRIVYRESPTQLGFYQYHRWITDPGAVITANVIGALRSSGLFAQVDSDAKDIKPEFLMTGKLERLDEIDYDGAVRVEVKLSVRLVNLRTASLIWSRDEAAMSRVEKATVDSVVVEMIMQRKSALSNCCRICSNNSLPQCNAHIQDFRVVRLLPATPPKLSTW